MPTASCPLPLHTIIRSNGPLRLSSRRINAVRRRDAGPKWIVRRTGVDAEERCYRNVSSRSPMNGPDPPAGRGPTASVDVKRPLLSYAGSTDRSSLTPKGLLIESTRTKSGLTGKWHDGAWDPRRVSSGSSAIGKLRPAPRGRSVLAEFGLASPIQPRRPDRGRLRALSLPISPA